jgi:hypothetical protein
MLFQQKHDLETLIKIKVWFNNQIKTYIYFNSLF